MKALNPFDIDLTKTTLIEASAGTGKTYTITTLYCRMVARGYSVESILVVTFTEAAAAELKIRIRHRLANALAQLNNEPSDQKLPGNDDDLVKALRCSKDLSIIVLRLQTAITSFDQASIMTIHSFCLKVLTENAFESRSLFDIELVPDRSAFLKQVTCDYFMSRINNLDPLLLGFLAQQNFNPERLANMFSNLVARQDLVVKPLVVLSENQSKNQFDEYRSIVDQIHGLLLNSKDQIASLIQNNKGINKQSYAKRFVPSWLEKTRMAIEAQGVNTLFKMTEKGDPIYKFTHTRLESKTKKGHTSPQHEFFDLCQKLLTFYHVLEENLICLKVSFLDYFKLELEKTKKAQGICFFDDLINDLAKILDNQEGPDLVKAIRQVYDACLIDEFQDTDPKQYDIFSRLFSSPGTPFFMVGDPKQAIYAFRGGDIFAYLKASKRCDQSATLQRNFRSGPLLVAGIESIFSRHDNPFYYDAIEFTSVTTPSTAVNRLIKDKKKVEPLQFCYIKQSDLKSVLQVDQMVDKQEMINKETAGKVIPKIVANDILALLQSDNRLLKKKEGGPDTTHSNQLNSNRVSPEDIAVLVRTNAQAGQIQSALSKLGIPSYQSGTGSVFDSTQAIELHDILWAVQHPDHKGYVKAALATSVFGCSSSDMVRLDRNEDESFQWQERFTAYKILWETRGFVSMIMALFHSDEAFLKQSPGLDERGMTNFYHLIELISQALLKQQLSPHYLFKWYTGQLSRDLRDETADELRLESDKKAVAIVTIHKSKGLEYPIVYLPYLWEGTSVKPKDHFLFHDPQNNDCLTLDLGSDEQETSQHLFEKEEQAEQRRLLYVALTRASAACRIIWGRFKTIETSALGSLLHPKGVTDDQIMTADLEQLRSCAPQSIRIDHPVNNQVSDGQARYVEPNQELQARLWAATINRKVAPVWSMSSFSAITHSVFSQHTPDINTGTKNMEPKGQGENTQGARITLSDFPKGAGAGDFFHSIYEDLDFTSNSSTIGSLIQAKARLAGFSESNWIKTAIQSVQEILNTKLWTGYSQFYLNQINNHQRFNELEFSFNVNVFDISSIKTGFKLSDPLFLHSGYVDKLSQISVSSFKGFIKGFIDLVVCHEGKWYILDYKTNYLGDCYEHYSSDAVFDAMSEHHYFLQYHLYLVALHRYLKLRLNNYDYDRDVGGVFYLFVRGMKPVFKSDYGVFFQKPDKAAIEYLSDKL
ncbi:MAG: exodeoxyribonuclease V subunit beta [Pseudomonadota bacterium]